eukprot:2818826-Rhodomonas_salina.2
MAQALSLSLSLALVDSSLRTPCYSRRSTPTPPALAADCLNPSFQSTILSSLLPPRPLPPTASLCQCASVWRVLSASRGVLRLLKLRGTSSSLSESFRSCS